MGFRRFRAAALFVGTLALVYFGFRAFGREKDLESLGGAIFAIGLGFTISWLDDRLIAKRGSSCNDHH